MVFDIQKSNNKKVEEMYERSMKELGEFFGMRWEENRPKVIFVPDREIYNFLAGEETEDWEEGSTFNSHNSIYVFPPEKIEKETSHTYSDESYFQFIKHELSHLFIHVVCGSIPVWIDEGLAVCSSGQRDKWGNPKEFNRFLESWDFTVQGSHVEMGGAVGILMDEFGKDQVINFAKVSAGIKSKEELGEIFKDFFGIELEYKWFNKFLK